MTNPSAKDVAKELDRIHRRRRLLILGGWAVLVILAALYLRCGRGWGTGGKGPGSGGTATGSATPAPHHCQVRVTAKGLELEGKPATQDAIIDGCKQGVDLVITGDSREGDSAALESALDAAKIPTFKRR